MAHNIVITGGPCGGKTTMMSTVVDELTARGYKVVVIPETATTLILGGISPASVGLIPFQNYVLGLQLKVEDTFTLSVSDLDWDENKIVYLYDRGAVDGKAFIGSVKEWKALLKRFKVTENELMSRYDGVIHMTTAAKGAEAYYTLENNAARSEDLTAARKADDALIKAWTGHPHLRVIDNTTDFSIKIQRAMSEIFSILGEPAPKEIERKYLVKLPDLDALKSNYGAVVSNIIQTYLLTDETEDGKIEKRIRQRGIDGDYSYYLTTKMTVTDLVRVEKEARITKDEYVDYLMQSDPDYRPIRKDRYCFVYNNVYFELDVYPGWKDTAILEVELNDEDEKVDMPDFIDIIKEVTFDSSYKNSSLARLPKMVGDIYAD